MSLTTLQVQLDRGVCTLTLNRPEVRNAMSMAMVQELLTALERAEANPAVRVVVLRGAGGHFCAGGDIGDMAQARMKLAQQQAQLSAGEAVTERNPIEAVNAAFGRLCLAYATPACPSSPCWKAP